MLLLKLPEQNRFIEYYQVTYDDRRSLRDTLRKYAELRITVKISNTLRHIVDGLPSEIVVEKPAPLTVGQLATYLKIPTVLIVIAFVDGIKCPLNYRLTEDAEIALIGPVAGG